MMYDPELYGITTRRTVIDGQTVFEATVGELPDVIGYGDTRAEAEEAAIEAIRGLQEVATNRGRSFPPPVAPSAEFSGRITLRLSKTLHHRAAFAAQAESVSLNTFIAEAVALRLEPIAGRPETVFTNTGLARTYLTSTILGLGGIGSDYEKAIASVPGNESWSAWNDWANSNHAFLPAGVPQIPFVVAGSTSLGTVIGHVEGAETAVRPRVRRLVGS